ncbi:DeoR/GlpR family DNA-binding transcription regulator [Plastorhodobacter daqingensis]|uniref:DeoR/GlpR family DNA-binding transcription regulator n=1 Tax=Plastorhodobacter daqingensis TaxID=1387281 RepID=A0ABW2UHQ3_9RHOB
MKPGERRDQIARAIRESGQLTVEDLAGRFSVSAETIRRDLSTLAESGAVQKVHGGARRLRLHHEGSFEERLATNAPAKQEIAAKIAAIVRPGDTLFIDTGSTTLACAEQLVAVPRLTVITNSLAIARLMGAGHSDIRVFLLGGTFSHGNAQTVGPLVLRQIAGFQADYALLTVSAVTAEVGAMDSSLDEAEVARSMMENARQVVVLADSDKLGKTAGFRVCRLAEIDMLVSDRPPPPPLARALAEAGVQVP